MSDHEFVSRNCWDVYSGPKHEKELEAYKELYPFGAPDMSSQEIAQMREKNKKDASDSAKQ